MKHLFRWLDLQLFAEGDGGTAAGTTGAAADQSDLSGVVYGKQAEETAPDAGAQQQEEPARDLGKEFEKLIKGEFKDVYAKRVQDTVTRRLKATSADVEAFHAVQPVLQMLSQRYGVDAADIKALSAAIEEDDSLYQAEAERMGVSVDQVKSIRKTERENHQLKEQLREQENRQKMEQNLAKWAQEAQAIAQKYPGLDLEKELANPPFFSALMNGASVEGAYWGLYHDQLIPQAMQYTAQETERKLVNKIQAQAKRPTENGAGAGVTVKSDVSQLSDKDMDEIIRRARRGEKIRF